MKTPHAIPRNPPPEYQPSDALPPIRRAGRRRPPLESRTDWEPWLPPLNAYPDIPGPLRMIAMILLVLLAVYAAMVFLALL